MARVSTTSASAADRARRAADLVRRLGGRYSTQLGIDVDAGDDEVERWFLAATLFGTRISATVAMRTFAVLDAAGVGRVADAGQRTWDELVALLDAGGYARYDFRTATRLQRLAAEICDRFGGRAASIGRRCEGPADLVATLDGLPGWGPVTVGLFLRELRGTWAAADVPVDRRAAWAAEHLDLLTGPAAHPDRVLAALATLATRAGVDLRDLESALVRAALGHRGTGAHAAASCPGGGRCHVLAGP